MYYVEHSFRLEAHSQEPEWTRVGLPEPRQHQHAYRLPISCAGSQMR
jgi:hypothetical protein